MTKPETRDSPAPAVEGAAKEIVKWFFECDGTQPQKERETVTILRKHFRSPSPEGELPSLTYRLENVQLSDGVWQVRIDGKSDLSITDPSGKRVHASNGQESTGIHLAMALDELRKLRRQHADQPAAVSPDASAEQPKLERRFQFDDDCCTALNSAELEKMRQAKSDLDAAAPAEQGDRLNGKTPWEFACAWYNPDDIAKCIAGNGRETFGFVEKIPADIYSREFAEWLTKQYRLAMQKGIQIGMWELLTLREQLASAEKDKRFTELGRFMLDCVTALSDAKVEDGATRDDAITSYIEAHAKLRQRAEAAERELASLKAAAEQNQGAKP